MEAKAFPDFSLIQAFRSLRENPLVLAALVGAVSGFFATAFWEAIAILEASISYLILVAGAPGAFFRPLFPAVGAFLAVFLARHLFGLASPVGVEKVMADARRGALGPPFRIVPAVFLNSILCIGSGGSAGREAPVVVMGGSLAAWFARKLRLPGSSRQILLAAGAAASIAAAFNAPLAGVFFAVEIILGDLRSTSLLPVVLASATGAAVCRATEGSSTAAHLQVPAYSFSGFWEAFLYLGLGVLCGIVAPLFVRLLEGSKNWLQRLPTNPLLVASMGGLGVGLLGLLVPGVLGNGYPWLIEACSGTLSGVWAPALLAGKMVATAVTLGTCGWGGDFAPMLFVGAMVGGSYGKALETVLGVTVVHSGSYAMVGMGALLAAAVRCPLTAIALLFELTGSYEVILPIMIAVAGATFVARRFVPLGLYHQRLKHLGGLAFEMAGWLPEVTVEEVMEKELVVFPEAAPLEDLLQKLLHHPQLTFPVVNSSGRLVGAVRLSDLRTVIRELPSWVPLVASDLAVAPVPLLTASMRLEEAAETLMSSGWEELPVVRDAADPRPCGLLSSKQVLAAAFSHLPTTGDAR
ncbi:MAG: chloride channel protein [Thermoanaerobaculaceae bacterium]